LIAVAETALVAANAERLARVFPLCAFCNAMQSRAAFDGITDDVATPFLSA